MIKYNLILFVIFIFILFGCKQKIGNSENDKTATKLIGSWSYVNQKLNDSKYQFFADSTWKFTMTMDDGKSIITKGKYLVGKDSEVFLRCFGSQHWPNNSDTIADLKSSLRSEVMFLVHDTLVDNQEDYLNEYIKVE